VQDDDDEYEELSACLNW